MNRNCYQLVFNASLGMVVPQAETARRRSKAPGGVTLGGAAASSALAGAVLASGLLAAPAWAVLPVAANGSGAPFVTYGQANYQTNGNVGTVSQVGNKSILNWQSFNISNGSTVKFQQVDSLTTNNLVQGASFTSLNRIGDINPSIISGAITQGAGQQANIILVNNNGIAFMNGAQVNLNTFTATSLNMADKYVVNGLFGDKLTPQFEGTGGFVKVMEGAQITAGSQGRVVLLAPTVVNRGTVTAPDGQVILAAGTKAYLRVADNKDLNLRGLLIEVDSPTNVGAANTSVPGAIANAAEDKLGLVSNSGTLSTPRGNITMVGYAVNQNGVAKATTSVVSNGSIYLMAKDSMTPVGATVDSSRAGQVVLGAGSVTAVLPDVADTTTAVDSTALTGLDQQSEIRVLGNRIYMAGGASVVAPSGKVDFLALDDPSRLTSSATTFVTPSNTARVDIAAGAVIDVAGLSDVAVSVARNTVEVQLRGDELKDSPINQVGALRGQTVYVDIAQAQANPNSLIAQDSLAAYAAKTTRTVAERSTAGGTVNVRSEGEAILENGATVNLSGGSLAYQSAVVNRSLVSSNGKLVDVSKALATTHYDSLPSQLVVNYGRWNRTETYSSGPTSSFVQGYTEGKNAGTLNLVSLGSAYMQADVQGNTTVGSLQRTSGTAPKGATLAIGNAATGTAGDYKINQNVLIKDGSSSLPAAFTKDSALSNLQQQTLELNSRLLGANKVANLQVYTNSSLDSQAVLNAPDKGSVTLVANTLTVQKDILTTGGDITLSARNTIAHALNDPSLLIADKVVLGVGGNWVNDKLAGASASTLPVLNAGSISVTAAANGNADTGGFINRGTVSFGQGVRMDASAGAYVSASGKISTGKAGALTIAGYGVTGMPAVLQAYGATQGGKLTLSANRLQLGGTAGAGVLGLDADFMTRGGFGEYALTGLTSLDVANNTSVLARQDNRQILATAGVLPTGAATADSSQVVLREEAVRKAVKVTLSSLQNDAGTGVLTIGQGATLATEAGGSIALNARNTLDVEGAVVARGGDISLTTDRRAGYVGDTANTNALWLGSSASLDASGTAVTYVDSKGLTQGTVYGGGNVSLTSRSGYVAAQEGSRISVAGATPVKLDVPNENGGIGRVVGSDAGNLQVFAQEGIVLASTLQAQAAGSGRSGNLSVTLSSNARLSTQGAAYDVQARELHLANTVANQAGGTSPAQANPLFAETVVTRARIGVDKIEAGGFDTVAISSRDGIVLEGNLSMGGGRALPMRELKLDAARIETDGGNVTLTADAVRLGNYDNANRVGTAGSSQNAGTLTARGRMLELAGNLRLQGMASSTLAGSELVQLSGVTRDKLDSAGVSTATYENSARISTTGNLTLQAGVVTPSSFGDVSLQAAGKTIRFEALGAAPTQPFSALGKLTVSAQNIEQAGRIWAPLGQVALNASNQVTLAAGSVTSVAADAGSVLPLGQIQNGLNWVVNVDPSQVPKGQLALGTLPQKSVSLNGASVDMQSGSTVNVAGGGNLQGYEFTVGPGGSRDILADANIYAVVPSFKGGFAPTDPQESFNLKTGTSIYLTGVPGLAAGTYTLLPAHYALLPGAYAVRLDTASTILPGQEYTRQDGVRIASGYLTDSRKGAPVDASYKGFEVLTNAQVHARSELTVTQASDFFASGNNRPMDAGQLAIATSGTGAASLQLNGSFVTAAATGGRGAAVDISADKLAIISGANTGIDPNATVLQVDTLNAMGARSLLLGGTRSVVGDTTTLQVGASEVTLANGNGAALQAPEVVLAASNNLTLKSGSKVIADGTGTDGGTLTTAGMGALVRVANSNTTFVRTGNPGNTQGTLTSEVVNGVGSNLVASNAITLDATKENNFKGSTSFVKAGQAVAGNLAVGASKVNFGDVGNAGNASGVTYSQAALNGLGALASMAFTSYSTFDLYGDVQVGAVDSNGRPLLNSVILQGAGLVGRGVGSNTASINAKTVQLRNPGALTYASTGAVGNGQLAITSDTLILGAGTKTLDGFGGVTIRSGQILGQGTGILKTAVPTVVNTARLSGAAGSDQTLAVSAGALTLNTLTPATALAASTDLGAKWSVKGDSVAINTAVDLHGGSFTAQANSGDVSIGATGRIDVSGQTVAFFDQQRTASAGKVALTSTNGNVRMAAGGVVDVSGAAGGDAGTLAVSAVNGTVQVNSGNLLGSNAANAAGVQGEGARVQADVGSLASFSDFNTALGNGFAGQRQLRVRNGNVTVAAADVVRAKAVDLSADNGRLTVAGTIDAAAAEQGSIALYASSDVTLASTGQLVATSSKAGKAGGTIAMGSTSGMLSTAAGSRMDVSAGSGGAGGQVNLRAARNAAGTVVNVAALDGSITGARSVVVEAVQSYTDINTLLATTGGSGTLGLDTIKTDIDSFGANSAAITSALGKTGDSTFHLRAGVEVQSTGDLTLGDGSSANDWNLLNLRTNGVEPGTLTLRAKDNLLINNNVSDGFSDATRYASDGKPTAVSTADSWSYRFVAGADTAAANVMRTRSGAAASLTLANDTMVRTGTGSVSMAAAKDIVLSNTGSVVYTAGKMSSSATPVSPLFISYTSGGGDVSLNAGNDIRMVASSQLYSEWLFRQGRLATNGQSYATQPSWWVRFDLFKQGVATLGGGNVSLTAGRDLLNVSASAATQGSLSSSNPATATLVKTGGGNVRLQAGGNVMGGQFYADNGTLQIKAGGRLGGMVTSTGVNNTDVEAAPFVYPVVALGDATARIEAQGDVNLLAILNPTLLPQSTSGSVGSTTANVVGNAAAKTARRTVFSTYEAGTAASLTSVTGNVTLHDTIQSGETSNMKDAYTQLATGENSGGTFDTLFNYLPPSLEMVALQGDVKLHQNQRGGTYTMAPSASGQLDLLAKGSVALNTSLVMSDRDPNAIPTAVRPATSTAVLDDTNPANASLLHAGTPVHTADNQAAHIVAVTGDVMGVSEVTEKATGANMTALTIAKAVQVRAGRDILDFNANIQNANADSVSYLQAGRDVRYEAGTNRSESDGIKVAGAGRLEVTAGRNLDLGTSGGIRSRGNLENANLGNQGADIQVAAGVGAQGIDYAGTVTRLLTKLQAGNVDAATLWQARWLTGDNSLSAGQATAAVAAIAAMPAEAQRLKVRDMVYTALRATGRDYNSSASGFGGDYGRGYAVLDLVFPGIATKATDGSFANYQGNVNLFASRIKSESGGNIEFMVPGGNVLVGLANTPPLLVGGKLADGIKAPLDDVLGIVVASAGDIKGFSRGDIVVNQSRILTVGGGDVLLWSSEGGIDAGKGKKTASAVPPPIVNVDSQGKVTQTLQGAATGSGIGALSQAGVTAGDVDLIAPKGTVNAGDAGIRAGNLNVAALDFKGADNVAVSGKSVGVPVADTSAVTAAASGASSLGDDASKTIAAASQNAAESARAAQALATSLKPTIVRVDVLGYGEQGQ